MTPLRQKMEADLRLRNLAETTAAEYVVTRRRAT